MFAGLMVMIVFFLVSEDPLRMGFGFGVYSGLMSFLVAVEVNGFFGCLLFFVFVGTLLVMFCIVVSIAPNPVFRLFSALVLIVSYVVRILIVEVYAAEYNIWLRGSGGEDYPHVSELTVGKLGYDCFRGLRWSGNVFHGLGVYGGVGWGVVLVYAGLVIILRVVSVVNLCARRSGPLVRFSVKGV